MPNTENSIDDNIFENFEKDNSQDGIEAENIKPLLNNDDFNDIVNQSKISPKEINQKFENYTSNKKFVSSVIKEEDTTDIKEFVTADLSKAIPLSNDSSNKFNDGSYINVTTERYDSNFKDLDILAPDSQSDILKPNMDKKIKSVNDAFIDYVKYPKISGNTRNASCGNILPEEDVDKKKEIIEISDTPNFTKFEQSNSVIEINRNEEGDMISIVVYCHCGEKTVIKFDYYDPDILDEEENNENLTDIVNDTVEMQPFDTEKEIIENEDETPIIDNNDKSENSTEVE